MIKTSSYVKLFRVCMAVFLIAPSAWAGSITVIPAGITAGGNDLFEFFLDTTGDVGSFDTYELSVQSDNLFNQVGAAWDPVFQPSEDSGFSAFLTLSPAAGGFELSAFGVIDTSSLVQATHASLGSNSASEQGNYLIAQVVMLPGSNGSYAYQMFDDGNQTSSGGDEFGTVIHDPGDFNGDGIVDGDDFLLWQRNSSVGPLPAWEANYGIVFLLSAASAAVPEPSSILLLAAGAAGLGMWRKRRAS